MFLLLPKKMSTKKKSRKKIAFCFKDYLKTLPEKDSELYLSENQALAGIILTSANDDEVISTARKFDADHGTDLFAQAVKFTIYCIACHRFDCTC